MQEAGSRIARPFLPIWRGALGDKSGATLSFTHESAAPDRVYLEWEQEAVGQRFSGVVLTFGGSGLIENVALHHRPLGAVLAFSAEMGRQLGSSAGPGVFYQAPQGG